MLKTWGNGLGLTFLDGRYVNVTGDTMTGDLNLGVHGLIAHRVTADASDGLLIEAGNGTDVAILGAGNTANALFYGGVNITGDLTVTGDDIFMTTNTANYFLMADGTNYNPTDPASARTGLGLVSGGAGDIWVEKVGDTMTGTLTINPSSDVGAFVAQEFSATPTGPLLVMKKSDGTAMWTLNKTLLNSVSAVGWTVNFDTASTVSSTTSRTGVSITMNAGYTGNSFTNALSFDNQIAGTDSTYTSDISTGFNYRVGGNRGITGFARATTTGTNVGIMVGSGKGNVNYAAWLTATTSKTTAINVGLLAVAQQANGGSNYSEIAGAFVMGTASTIPNITNLGGVVLLADNWLRTTAKIFQARQASADVFVLAANGVLTATPSAVSSGTQTSFTFTPPANTGMAASTEVSQFILSASTQSWATGALTTQRYARIDAMTVAFTGASTLTTGINLEVSSPTTGSNATITSVIALRVGSANTQVTAAGLNYQAIGVPDHTLTVTGTTQVTSSTTAMVNLGQLTITDSSAVTYDNASTLYIKDAPVAAGSVTLTNKYAIWVDNGLSRLDGGVTFAGSGQSTLSNYTEGTFTPTVTLVGGAGNTTPVYSTNTGRYTRIGNRVFVDVYLTGDGGNEGAGTGQINIALPVTAGASHPTSLFPCGYALNNVTEDEIWGQIAGSATTISLVYFNAINTTANLTGADQNSTTRTIRLKFSYEV